MSVLSIEQPLITSEVSTDPAKIFSEFSTEEEFTIEEKELIDSSLLAIKRGEKGNKNRIDKLLFLK